MSTNYNLFKNTSLYSIGNIIPRVVQFVLLPIFTQYLSPAEYGIINSLQVLGSILAVIFTFAIERSIFRLFYDYKTELEQKIFIGTVIISLFTISTVALIFIFIFNQYVELIYSSINFYPYYCYAILTSYLYVFSLIPKIHFQVSENAKSFLIVSLIELFTSTLFIIWLVIFNNGGAAGYLLGSLLGSAIIIPYYFIILKKISILKFDKYIFYDTMKYSLPMIPMLISGWVMDLSDRIFIEHYFSLKDVGLYSMGYKIGGLIIIFSEAFNRAYNPYYFKVANNYEGNQAKDILYKTNNLYLSILILCGFLISFFSKDVIYLLFNPKFYDSYKIIPIICLAYIVGQSTGLLNMSIYQMKKTAIVMYLFIICAFVNIGLNFLLIPIYGAFGAAYATLLTYLFLLFIEYQISKKYFFIPFNWKHLGLFFLCLLILFLIFTLFLDVRPIIAILIKAFIFTIILILIYNRYYSQIVEIIKK